MFRKMRPSVSTQQCYVLKLAYGNAAERDMIHFLAGLAAGQRSSFRTIFPWEFKFTAKSLIFVALTRPKSLRAPDKVSLDMLRRDAHSPTNSEMRICGWMTVTLYKKERYTFINVLSTRAAADASYGGNGAALLRAVETDAAERNFKYVALYPLNDVRGFYAKSGYVPMHPELAEMYKPIASVPSPDVIRRKLEAQASDSDMELWKELLTKLPADERRYLSAKPSMRFEALAIFGDTGRIEDVQQWAHNNVGFTNVQQQ
jgi:hypothetical protein